MPSDLPDELDADPVALVARIAQLLPSLDGDHVERLANALDELTEAVGLRLDLDHRT